MNAKQEEPVDIEWVWDPEDLEDDTSGTKEHLTVKGWHIVLLAVAVLLTLLLAWWQWTRFQSGSGTFQNLGYAFQWPLFGIFFIYAYRMILRYENRAIDEHNAALDPDAPPQPPREKDQVMTEIDEDFLPPRPQLDIEEFNALNQQHRNTPGRKK